MIAKILRRGKEYFCSNCFMRQPKLISTCIFCQSIFTNYEQELLKAWKEEKENENEGNLYE